MLVLSRKHGKQIVIGDELIVLTVVEIGREYVKIGVDAPGEMTIHRREVFERIKTGN